MKSSVFFEQILPINWSQIGISASKSRRALEDAIECKDTERTVKAVKEYKLDFQHLLKEVGKHKTSLTLREQPCFEWSWDDSSWMSSCWQFEHTMIHAYGYRANIDMALKLCKDGKWQAAGRACNAANELASFIHETILPKWSWKAQQMFIALPMYWKSNVLFSSALKDLCTVQYGYSTEISRTNALKLLNRVEQQSKDSLLLWTNGNNKSLMNWAMVSKEVLTAANHVEVDEYGKAIGLLQRWQPVFEELKEDHMFDSMKLLHEEVNKVLLCKKEWESVNNNIHYQVIS